MNINKVNSTNTNFGASFSPRLKERLSSVLSELLKNKNIDGFELVSGRIQQLKKVYPEAIFDLDNANALSATKRFYTARLANVGNDAVVLRQQVPNTDMELPKINTTFDDILELSQKIDNRPNRERLINVDNLTPESIKKIVDKVLS